MVKDTVDKAVANQAILISATQSAEVAVAALLANGKQIASNEDKIGAIMEAINAGVEAGSALLEVKDAVTEAAKDIKEEIKDIKSDPTAATGVKDSAEAVPAAPQQ